MNAHIYILRAEEKSCRRFGVIFHFEAQSFYKGKIMCIKYPRVESELMRSYLQNSLELLKGKSRYYHHEKKQALRTLAGRWLKVEISSITSSLKIDKFYVKDK